jgi:signal transduction histidine kinase
VVGDARLLTLAVEHLLCNALEATAGREAGPPEVSATADGDRVVVRVRDRGPGLRSSNARLLIRLGQSTKSGHRGLGLLTVERIARLHGGHLSFESPGDGALVSLHLPGA